MASQEQLRCENCILPAKGRTMSLRPDLWHCKFLPNQCLCEGSLYNDLLPRMHGRKTSAGTALPLGAAWLSEGLTPIRFKRPKKSPLGTCFMVLLRTGYHYMMCIKYQRYACVPATVCGPCLFQWLKLSCKWVTAIGKLPIFYNVNNTTLSLYDRHLWSWCAANMSTCHSVYGGSLGLSAILSWEQ